MAHTFSFRRIAGAGESGRFGSIAAAVYDFASLLVILAFIALLTVGALILLPIALMVVVAGLWFANRRARRQAAHKDGWVIEGVAEER